MTKGERRVVLALASALVSGAALACGGDDAGKAQMQAAADSLGKQRDSAMARMDSAGVIHNDSTTADSTKHDSTTTKKKPS